MTITTLTADPAVNVRELQLIDLASVWHLRCCRRLRGEVGLCGHSLPEHETEPESDRDICSMCWAIAEEHDIPQCYYDELADCPGGRT